MRESEFFIYSRGIQRTAAAAAIRKWHGLLIGFTISVVITILQFVFGVIPWVGGQTRWLTFLAPHFAIFIGIYGWHIWVAAFEDHQALTKSLEENKSSFEKSLADVQKSREQTERAWKVLRSHCSNIRKAGAIGVLVEEARNLRTWLLGLSNAADHNAADIRSELNLPLSDRIFQVDPSKWTWATRELWAFRSGYKRHIERVAGLGISAVLESELMKERPPSNEKSFDQVLTMLSDHAGMLAQQAESMATIPPDGELQRSGSGAV